MGSMVIACYRPKPGKQAELEALVREHLVPLRAEGLVSDRDPVAMRAADGTILEIFEWKSEEAVQHAHKSPVVQELWKRFEVVCEYAAPASVPELQKMFSHFEPP